MQFQIPQFIEIEDKIAGPLTLKQLLFLLGAGGLSVVSYFIFTFWLWLIITAILAAISVSFAFLKYNGQPMLKIAIIALGFLWKPRLYVWKREIKEKIFELPGEDALNKRKKLKDFSFEMPSVKKLWTDLTTSKNPIPKREKKIPIRTTKTKEAFDIFRKLTGEKEVAKRVDYR